MGCFYENKISEEKLIEILIDKRRNLFKEKNKKEFSEIIYFDKELKQLQEIFYKDINNEKNLVNYLDTLLIKGEKEKFEYELILYFDVLSSENRCRYTGSKNFKDSIDIFSKMIDLIYDLNYEEIKELDAYKNKFDICGREELLLSKNFSFKEKISTEKDKKDFSILKNNYLNNILKKRKTQKISLNNSEIFFNNLLQLYFEVIEKDDKDQIDYIGEIIKDLYYPIKAYIDRIKNKEILSQSEIKTINAILFAPIIADNKNRIVNIIKHSFEGENNNENYYEIIHGIKFYIKDNYLYIEYFYKKITDGKIIKNTTKIPNPRIYNLQYLKSEFYNLQLKKELTRLNFLKYVKIQLFQENNFYTYNKIYWEFNKKIIKNILQSNTITTLFQDLYPNMSFIFEKEENINILLDSIIFVPYPLYKSYGYTFKKGLIIFIDGSIDPFYEQIIYLSKSFSLILSIIHEACSHWASAFLSFIYQDISLFDSITFTKELLIDMGLINKNEKNLVFNTEKLLKHDGGDVLELILLGKKLIYFSLNEILFLLCKNSYNVNYENFRKNFLEINNKRLEDLFIEVSKDKELEGLMKYFKIDLKYFEHLKKIDNLNFSFKRNGEMISNSKCGYFRF